MEGGCCSPQQNTVPNVAAWAPSVPIMGGKRWHREAVQGAQESVVDDSMAGVGISHKAGIPAVPSLRKARCCTDRVGEGFTY